ncbi:hypothetical protein [Acidocella sp.]|uniref:hypothetical protein n=1 Tax=Acidocella sp. TaxID=50710 RepID=UPI003CFFC070
MEGDGGFSGLVSQIVSTIFGLAAAIDNLLVGAMLALGIFAPQWQLCILLIFISLVVMLVMRTLGGLFGWVALLFSIVLLLHYIVPELGQ